MQAKVENCFNKKAETEVSGDNFKGVTIMADIFQTENETYEIDVPKEKRYLNSMSYDYSVQYIYDLIKRGKIILEVPFQRKQIWKTDKASSLIESIIMNVPIPPLYFAEEENGNWLVLDGLQRLSSIKNFYDNEFSLTKLEVLTDLNKMKYKDLPPKSKSLLDDGIGKTGKNNLKGLLSQIDGDQNPFEGFNKDDFNKLDSVLQTRHLIVHQDRFTGTETTVEDSITFIKKLVEYIDEYLSSKVPV